MDRLQQRGHSGAVITKGGKTVWLAGPRPWTIAANRWGATLTVKYGSILRNLGRAPQKARGKLSDTCG